MRNNGIKLFVGAALAAALAVGGVVPALAAGRHQGACCAGVCQAASSAIARGFGACGGFVDANEDGICDNKGSRQGPDNCAGNGVCNGTGAGQGSGARHGRGGRN